MKGSGTGRQNYRQPQPSPTTTISIRGEGGNKKSKMVSAFRSNQDRSYLRPHQGRKEKERRLKQKAKLDAK